MRLWSIHPCYLDALALTACWREGLLARAVLAGQTVGYRRHPQLTRFFACADPEAAINTYLTGILDEAQRRGYRFDASKVGVCDRSLTIPVTAGQLAYEFAHLKEKLKFRAPHLGSALGNVTSVDIHPLFRVTPGDVETWEIIR